MRTTRYHQDAQNEINTVTGEIKGLLQFHRRQIQLYCQTMVQEGHRAAVKEELRRCGNDCIMPLLEITDRLRALNLELGSSRGPMRDYRPLVIELTNCQGLLQLMLHIEPEQLIL